MDVRMQHVCKTPIRSALSNYNLLKKRLLNLPFQMRMFPHQQKNILHTRTSGIGLCQIGKR